MSTRPILIVALLAVLAAFLSGCGGPTKKGIEARNRARVRLDRVNAELSYDQAMQAFEAGQFEKAEHELRIAIQLHPEWAEYRVLEGRIHLETHRLERAIESFEAALQIKPGYADAHYYSGIVYQRWSDDAKAYDQYMAAYEMDPESVGYLLAAAESMVALEQFDAAKDLLEEQLDYFEHNSAMRHLLARIALLRGNPQKAIELYSEARRLDPENDTLLEELVQAQYEAGAHGDCYRSVKQLQDMSDTDRPDLKLLEARCLAFLDRLPESRSLYLELSRLRPTSADVWIELGSVALLTCGSSWAAWRGSSATTTAWPCAAHASPRWRRIASRATCSRASTSATTTTSRKRPCSCGRRSSVPVTPIFHTWSWAGCSSRPAMSRARSTPTPRRSAFDPTPPKPRRCSPS